MWSWEVSEVMVKAAAVEMLWRPPFLSPCFSLYSAMLLCVIVLSAWTAQCTATVWVTVWLLSSEIRGQLPPLCSVLLGCHTTQLCLSFCFYRTNGLEKTPAGDLWSLSMFLELWLTLLFAFFLFLFNTLLFRPQVKKQLTPGSLWCLKVEMSANSREPQGTIAFFHTCWKALEHTAP